MQHVIDLELALLTAHVRRSRARVDELLEPDVTEIGASGRQLTPDLVPKTYLCNGSGRGAG